MELRLYQREAVAAVYEHLRTRDDNPCVVIPTAGGKTPVMAAICRDAVQLWQGRVLILAHVRELLEQAAEKLHLVAPDLPVGIYSAGLKRRDLGYAVTIAGIQSIYEKACDVGTVDLVIVDECFVAGTLVSTPAGELPIEHIQPGMYVHNAIGMGRVLATSARATGELVMLEYSDGTTITCTPSHPIFTESGWRSAGTLEVGSLAFGVEGVRVLRARVPPVVKTATGRQRHNPAGESLAETAVLLDLLFQDPQQLHEGTGSPRKGQRHVENDWARTEGARGERTADRTAKNAVGTAGQRLGRGIRSFGAGLRVARPPEASEDRHRASAEEDRHRTGWSKSPVAGSPYAGCAQDDLPGTKRLVRISRHEPARDRVVFNLHVSGHPSYFANGLLAHNCHLIPEDGEGMYRTFLTDARKINPQLRVIGMTATPFRMKSGSICAPDNILNTICYEVGVRELIVQGYLCPLRTKAGSLKPNTDQLHVRGGEYIAGEVEDLMDEDNLVLSACREIIEHTQDRKSVLIFASGVRHGQHICRVLTERHHVECGFVCGETLPFDRDETLRQFRSGELKFLCNVNVLTTGFDAPGIDCVALMRPTLSPGLFYQMVGRGFRMSPGKADCLVLDFGRNTMRHGPVDQLRIEPVADGDGKAPVKECPQCHELIAAGCLTCPDCGHQFPDRTRPRHEATAGGDNILSETTQTEYEVTDVFYSIHVKRGAPPDAPRTMRVDYRVGFNEYVSEWICFEHTGFAREKAARWWRTRSNEPVPDTIEDAIELADTGALAKTLKITVERKSDDKFDRIVRAVIGPRPTRRDTEPANSEIPQAIPDDDIPF